MQPNATVNTIGPIVLSFESLPKDQSVSHVYNMMLGYEAHRNSSKFFELRGKSEYADNNSCTFQL